MRILIHFAKKCNPPFLLFFIISIQYLFASSGLFISETPLTIQTYIYAFTYLSLFAITFYSSRVFSFPRFWFPSLRFSNNLLLTVFFCIGISSLLLYSTGKLVTSVTSLLSVHELRAQAAFTVSQAEVSPTTFTSIAFVLYPAAFVGLAISYFKFEYLSNLNRLLAFLTFFSIILFSIFTGSRSAIILTFFLLLSVSIIRLKLGLSFLPSSKILSGSLLIIIPLAFLYLMSVFVSRSDASHTSLSEYYALWRVKMSPTLEMVLDKFLDPSLVLVFFQSTYYFLQSSFAFERILSLSDSLPGVYHGSYQVDALSWVFRQFPGLSPVPDVLNQLLIDEYIYGFFVGPFGGSVLDFSLPGSFIFSLISGFITGRCWKYLCYMDHDLSSPQVFFWLASCFWAFIGSPLGFANSSLVLLWFFIWDLFSSHKPLLPTRLSSH